MTSIPAWMPQTQHELWSQWLDWRLPHYDAMAREASQHLTGTRHAVMRVGWDGTSGRESEDHATLFTLTDETPDPAVALEAAERYTPFWILLRHVASAELSPEEVTPSDPRAAQITVLVDAAVHALRQVDQIASDDRAPTAQLEKLRRTTEEQLDATRREVETTIVAGLERRHGFFLTPPAIVTPESALQTMLYEMVLSVRTQLEIAAPDREWRPSGIAVCNACSVVFTPKRGAQRCESCRDHPPEANVLGELTWEPGATQTVRVPQLVGRVVVGWKSVTIGMCPGCGQPFMGRRDAKACAECSPKMRQRRRRRRSTP